VINPWSACQRLAHQAAGIDGENHGLVLLGSELFRQELCVSRGLFPVDGAAIHSRQERSQRLEL
jgi:hypothetical protein